MCHGSPLKFLNFSFIYFFGIWGHTLPCSGFTLLRNDSCQDQGTISLTRDQSWAGCMQGKWLICCTVSLVPSFQCIFKQTNRQIRVILENHAIDRVEDSIYLPIAPDKSTMKLVLKLKIFNSFCSVSTSFCSVSCPLRQEFKFTSEASWETKSVWNGRWKELTCLLGSIGCYVWNSNGGRREMKFLSQLLDAYSVLVIHTLDFRLDRNLLLLPSGTAPFLALIFLKPPTLVLVIV